MGYEVLAKLIENNYDEFVQLCLVDPTIKTLPNYAHASFEQLKYAIRGSTDKIISYIQINDSAQWRDYIEQVAIHNLRAGLDVSEIIVMGNIMTESAKKLVEKYLLGEENQRTRERFTRRLDGLHTLAMSTVVATRVKRGNEINNV